MNRPTQRLEIDEVGDAVVARFTDRKLLDEFVIEAAGAALFALVDGRRAKEVIVDFANVEYMSSAMLGKLITLDKRSKAAGMRVKFCGIRREISENFSITGLDMLFYIYQTVDTALEASLRLVADCPASGCQGSGWTQDVVSRPKAPTIRCTTCSAQFRLQLLPRHADSEYMLTELELPTYDGERVFLRPWDAKSAAAGGGSAALKSGGRWRLGIEGRLDLFAAEAVERCVRSVPLPRRIAIDLTAATELTDAAVETLEGVGRGLAEGDLAVLLARAEQRDALVGIGIALPVFLTPEEVNEALPALPSREMARLPVRVRLE